MNLKTKFPPQFSRLMKFHIYYVCFLHVRTLVHDAAFRVLAMTIFLLFFMLWFLSREKKSGSFYLSSINSHNFSVFNLEDAERSKGNELIDEAE